MIRTLVVTGKMGRFEGMRLWKSEEYRSEHSPFVFTAVRNTLHPLGIRFRLFALGDLDRRASSVACSLLKVETVFQQALSYLPHYDVRRVKIKHNYSQCRLVLARAWWKFCLSRIDAAWNALLERNVILEDTEEGYEAKIGDSVR